MTDTTVAMPNPADFSLNEKPGDYTATFEVSGTISFHIKADSQEDAQRQAEAELERIENDSYVEINSIDEADLRRVTKDRAMYRVMREGKAMQVSHLQPGDLPREPDDKYGF